MKTQQFYPIAAMILALFLGSCTKEQDPVFPAIGLVAQQTAGDPAAFIQPQKPVNLGTASSFAILSEYGITRPLQPASVSGDIGSSPLSGEGIHLLCNEVKGNVYIVPGAGPYPCAIVNPSLLSKAVSDMEAAYNYAAGLTSPNFRNIFSGKVGSIWLRSGLYKWDSSLALTNNIFLYGGPKDVFIFQVGGTLDVYPNIKINLVGGVQAKNVFWQAAGNVTIGESTRFQGVILTKQSINVMTDATVNGQLLAQFSVSLRRNTITHPGTATTTAMPSSIE